MAIDIKTGRGHKESRFAYGANKKPVMEIEYDTLHDKNYQREQLDEDYTGVKESK